MSIFKKFKLFIKKPKEMSQHEKNESLRLPNHDAFEDDPLLNLEPILEGTSHAKQKKAQYKKLMQSVNNETQIVNEKQNNFVFKDSPLNKIISNAKKTNEKTMEKVYASSETQKKLKLIESIKKNGGEIPDYLYTDLSKSNSSNEYRNKANKLSSNSYNSSDIHSQLKKRRKLSEENQKRLKEESNLKDFNSISFKKGVKK